MNHQMIEEPSSCETASNSEPSPSCYIVLDIYFTSILRDPSSMDSEANIMKKRFKLTDNCLIFSHKENAKVKVAHTKRETAKLLADGFEIIAEVKLQKKPTGKYTFSLQRNIGPNAGYYEFRKVFGPQKNNLNSFVFYSVRSDRSHSENQQIRHNDLIKFGKEVYLAKIFSHSHSKENSIKMTDLSPIEQQTNFQVKNNKGECKICLMGQGQYEKDYVVSPCKCSGTCSLIHVQCLKKWIAHKIQVGKGDEKLHTYDMSRFSCEICKEKYPQALQIDQSFVDISPSIGLNGDTLVLTKIFPTEDQKRISHLVSLQRGGNLSVGRHYYNELILEDMSISRNHASIQRLNEDKFYLYDKNARFGTFINLKSPIHNLNEAVLISSNQTFRLRLFEEEPLKQSSSSRCDEEQVTLANIQY